MNAPAWATSGSPPPLDRVPFMRLLGMRRNFTEGGRAQLEIDARPELENIIAAVHGGVVATLVDVAMASAAVSAVGFTRTAVTLSMATSYLQPGRGRLTADGAVVERSGDVVHCEARVTDEHGATVAHAVGAFRYLDARPETPGDER